MSNYQILGGKRLFYKETGIYNDWAQIKKLPSIDTLVDIGVGINGTPELYNHFDSAHLVLIDPTTEAKNYAETNLTARSHSFYNCGVGEKSGELILNVEEDSSYSSFLEVADINFRADPIDRRTVKVDTLDNIMSNEKNSGRIGVKIDTEGFELNVIKGASKTLKNVDFVLAEVRHNHESFKDMYSLDEFIEEMFKNNFILTMIVTAKPFIADLCFQPRRF
jgi:FkbM family methyltransferase